GQSRSLSAPGLRVELVGSDDAGAGRGAAAAQEALHGSAELGGAFQLRAVAAVVDEIELRVGDAALQRDAVRAGDEAIVGAPDDEGGDVQPLGVGDQAPGRQLAN